MALAIGTGNKVNQNQLSGYALVMISTSSRRRGKDIAEAGGELADIVKGKRLYFF
ncbi:hypothetical protein [Thalassomonas sp. RHCl1]|uniref:hypothetical protein n=1 Tax=Thalassomonas sp. RHCl1 TaxID=2995320 RepID=UPI00248C657A|nr:hypothetical protein [Thalassomonas sp. RHCl1]